MPITLKTGSLTVTIPSHEPKEAFKGLSFWSSEFPNVCGHCKSTEIIPSHRNVKGFDFYSAKCSKCSYEAPYGQYKDGGGLFLKRDEGWKPPYKHDAGEQQAAKSQMADDDIEF